MQFRRLLFALSLIPGIAAAQAADPLAGAWEQTAARDLTTGRAQEQAPPALQVIFYNGHYVQFRAAANRARIDVPRDKMTREQLLERGDMQGQYGTYRVDSNRLTRHIITAADPLNEGLDAAQEFKIDLDVLTVTGTNRQGQKIEARFRRLR